MTYPPSDDMEPACECENLRDTFGSVVAKADRMDFSTQVIVTCNEETVRLVLLATDRSFQQSSKGILCER